MLIGNETGCLCTLLLACGTARTEALPRPVAELERMVGTWMGVAR